MTTSSVGERTDGTAPPLAVLIVDDEKNIRTTLRMCLESLGVQVAEAGSAQAAQTACGHRQFDLAFVDLRLGKELLPERIAQHAALPQLGGNYTLEEIEREHIQRVLARTTTAEEAARSLGIDTSTLWRRRKRYEGT